jgi:hypothetical protein
MWNWHVSKASDFYDDEWMNSGYRDEGNYSTITDVNLF